MSTITRKPKAQDKEAEALRIIEEGGTTTRRSQRRAAPRKRFAINLQAPADLIERVDAILQESVIPKTRTSFIFEAIDEKLRREER